MYIELLDENFNALQKLEHYQNTLTQSGCYGAMANFIGTMRDNNENQQVSEMYLEHYPKMTEKVLQEIVNQSQQKWDIFDCLVLHRIGAIKPNESIVVVATWSTHRAAAFDSCRFIMEQLKSNAPFWKREKTDRGHLWVAKNTPG